MAVAVGIVGAVVGAASAASSISQQNSAAASQKEALSNQAKLNQQSIALQLYDLERQRLYADQQSQLDQVSRGLSRQVEMQQNQLQRNELVQQGRQSGAEYDVQRQLNRSQLQQQTAQNQVQYDQQGRVIQGQLGQVGAQANAQQLNFGGQMAGIDANQMTESANLQAQRQQADSTTRAAGIQSNYALGQQQGEIAGQAEQAGKQLSQNMGQLEGARAAAYGQGGLSTASQALLNRNMAEAVVGQQTFNQEANRQTQLLDQQQRLEETVRNNTLERNQAQEDFGQAVLDEQSGRQRNVLSGNYAIDRMLNQNARQGLNIQNQERGYGRDLANAVARGEFNNSNASAELARNVGQRDRNEARQSLNIDRQVTRNQFNLGEAQSRLQQQFFDTALTTQRLSTSLAGQEQLNALRAQRGAIQSPGALGMLGALAQGGANIYGAVQGMRQSQQPVQPTNPYYNSGGFLSSYSIPATNMNNFNSVPNPQSLQTSNYSPVF